MTVTPRPSVALMSGYHSPQLDVAVRLNTNEAPTPPPPAYLDALRAAVDGIAWHRYPDREARPLRSALGGLHGVGPDQVFAANGSNEVLQTLLLTYGGPGRTVAVWEPTYALHSHVARIVGSEVAVGERAASFALDLAEVDRVLAESEPSVAFLCSPNNPTGVVDPEGQVREVLERTAARDCLLVVDEAYGQFASWSALALLGDGVPLVVTRTFSKTWSMAALRLGYLIGPAAVVAELHKVVLPYHLDAFTQRAGELAVDYVPDMQARVATLVEERGRVASSLGGLDVDVWPSGANFILFRPRRVAGVAVWQALVDRGVLVRDCSSWPRLEGCLRVTMGTAEEDDTFLAALEEILS